MGSFFFQPQYGDADFIIIPQNEMCKSHRMNVFIGVIYAYKGLLLVSDRNGDDVGDNDDDHGDPGDYDDESLAKRLSKVL